MIIDPQVDFHEGGNLAVAGADADSKRILAFIKLNLQNINKIFVSLDTHTKNHIGHPGYWKVVDENGDDVDDPEPLKSMTVFSFHTERAIKGTWKDPKKKLPDEVRFYAPERAGEDILSWTINYVKNIEKYGKGPALIWPTHCIEGSEGHKITPILRETLASLGDKVEYHIKGQNELSEMYSIFKAEIVVDPELSKPGLAYSGSEKKLKRSSKIDKLINVDVQDGVFLNTGYNTELFTSLVKDGASIAVCGEALSHCANWSLRDLVDEIVKPTYVQQRPPKIVDYFNPLDQMMTKIDRLRNKVIVLANASSAVGGFEKNVDDLMYYCKGVGVTVAKLLDDGSMEELD